MMLRNQIVQLMLPWFGSHDGELYYTPMSLSEEGKVDRRRAFRIVRKWYKSQIGVTLDKLTLQRIWKRRHQTWSIDEADIGGYLHQLARDTYEETIAESNSGAQEDAPKEAGI